MAPGLANLLPHEAVIAVAVGDIDYNSQSAVPGWHWGSGTQGLQQKPLCRIAYTVGAVGAVVAAVVEVVGNHTNRCRMAAVERFQCRSFLLHSPESVHSQQLRGTWLRQFFEEEDYNPQGYVDYTYSTSAPPTSYHNIGQPLKV